MKSVFAVNGRTGLKSFRSISIFFAMLTLFVSSIIAFIPTANAQTSTVTEQVEAGTLDRDKVYGPRWIRVDFEPLTTGEHTITVAWDSDADIRFSLFENSNGNSRIVTVRGTPMVGQWTGTLDETLSYHLGMWSASGSANYTVTLSADNTQVTELAISAQPTDVLVDEGESASFSVTASGSGDLAYQWMADGIALTGATESVLTLPAVAAADTGTVYSVSVTDDNSAIISDGATLSVIEATVLEIVSNPEDVSVDEGETASFSVVATGNGTLNYQWSMDGVAIDGATESSLLLSDVSLEDAGVYRVQVTDDSDAVGFAGATLTVTEVIPLLITVQPADVRVEEGESATFAVTASGSGVLSYQWLVNNEAIAGATSSELALLATEADDGNVYSVAVSDDNGSITSDPAMLMVEVMEIEPPKSTFTVAAGTLDSSKMAGPRWIRVNFDALATATHTVTVSWDSDADVRFIVRDTDDSNLSSTIRGDNPGVWQGDLVQGQAYSLALWSADGIANYEVDIQTAIPVTINTQPSNLIVTEGENASFVVEASGSGAMGFQWYVDGVALEGETADSLTIFGTSLADNDAAVTVEVSNGFEIVSSQIASLTVNEIPSLGLFSLAADESAWVLQGPAPTLDNLAGADTDAWGRVLLRVGDLLLVGGDFQGIKPTRFGAVTPSPYLATLNAVSGQPANTFEVPAEVDSVVRSLVLSPDGTQIFIGGDFGLLIVDSATGALDTAIAATDGADPGRVFDIAVTNTQIYVGGDFTHIDGVFRANIARLSLGGVVDTTWSPNVTNGFSSGRAAPVQAIAVSPSADTVYIGGNFDLIEGTPVGVTPHDATISMLSVSALDGTVQPERFSPFVGNNERAVMVHDMVVTDFYVMIAWGGPNFVSFHSTDGTRLRQYAGKGDVQALQVVGDHVFVGHHGEFFNFLPNPIPQEALVSLEPEVIESYKLHSFRIDDGSFEAEQAWQITGAFGIWGIAVAEDALWVTGQISVAGSNERRVDGLVKFPAID